MRLLGFLNVILVRVHQIKSSVEVQSLFTELQKVAEV